MKPSIRVRAAAPIAVVVLLAGMIGPGTTSVAAATNTLVGAGDISTCGSVGDTATAKLVASIPGTVFTAGDNVYNSGTSSEFASCYDPTWGAFRARTRPAPGNHDYGTAGATGYYAYFGTSAGPAGKGFYAYDLGQWRIYSLNSEIVSAEELTWLENDLDVNPRPCVMAYWHHALFSSGQHGNDASVKPLWDLLYSAGAELVINGHDHDYERFAPQTPSGAADATNGIREVVVGTGGAGERGFSSVQPNSQLRNAASWGVVVLQLSDTGYSGTFRPASGTFTDSFSGTCHGPGSTTPPPSTSLTLTTSANAGSVALSWNAVSGATVYHVKRAIGSGVFTKIADVTTRTYTDQTAKSGTTYRYRVVAAGTTTVKSNIATVTAK